MKKINRIRVVLNSFHEGVHSLESLEPAIFIHCKHPGTLNWDGGREPRDLCRAANALSTSMLQAITATSGEPGYIRALFPESILYAPDNTGNWFTLVIGGLGRHLAAATLNEAFRIAYTNEDWESVAGDLTIEV